MKMGGDIGYAYSCLAASAEVVQGRPDAGLTETHEPNDDDLK